MANHKLLLDEEMDEPYSLVAIHCSEEEYKMAYLLNLHIGTKFTRRSVDLDFSNSGTFMTFPIYDFEDLQKCNSFYLVSNSCRMEEAGIYSSGGLFASVVSDKSKTHYLLPEFKKVDYFLKIYADYNERALRQLISEIHEIKQVISAYEVDYDEIKSKNNLIFD